MNNMTCTMESISPAIAEIYLGRNFDTNRTLKKRHVELLKADMLSGNYEEMNPQNALVFDCNGILKDGQHRLHAIVESGVTIKMWVWKNVPESVHIFDRGASRKAEDTLVIGGMDKAIANSRTVALVKLIVLECFGSNKRWTDEMVGAYLKKHGEDIALATKICGKNNNKGVKCIVQNAAISSGTYCALRYGMSEDKLREFMSICTSGIPNETWQTAPLLLRRFITEKRETPIAKKGTETYRKKLFNVTLKALLDFGNKTTRKRSYDPSLLSEKDFVFARFVKSQDEEEIKEIENISI